MTLVMIVTTITSIDMDDIRVTIYRLVIEGCAGWHKTQLHICGAPKALKDPNRRNAIEIRCKMRHDD
jgi:hypothetical protein